MSADEWELKTQHKLHCHESDEDLETMEVCCCQPEGRGGARRRPAAACRQPEVTEVSPQGRPAVLKTHPECTFSLETREHRGIVGNGFRSTDDTFRINEVLDVVNIWESTKRENIKGICSRLFGISQSYLLLWCALDYYDLPGSQN